MSIGLFEGGKLVATYPDETHVVATRLELEDQRRNFRAAQKAILELIDKEADLLKRLSKYEEVTFPDGVISTPIKVRFDPTVTPEDVAATNARHLKRIEELETQVSTLTEQLEVETARLSGERDHQRENKNQAYLERNMLVVALARIFPSGIAKTAIEGWNPEWHNCVYIDGPFGQASWHYHDSQTHLFDHLRPYDGHWDGHTTELKYDRIVSWAKCSSYPTSYVVRPTSFPIPTDEVSE